MSLKEYGIAFMLAGKLSNDFERTFKEANKKLHFHLLGSLEKFLIIAGSVRPKICVAIR